MPSSLTEMLIAAACLFGAIVLGLPAVIRALKLLQQGSSFRQDEAANDERFLA